MIGEYILRSLSRDPAAPAYRGGTDRATAGNALEFLMKTVPGFLERISGRDILDFGCGHGLQALAMSRYALRVTGLDLPRESLRASWERHRSGNLRFTTKLDGRERFDVVVSCSSFEHFGDPAAILVRMQSLARPGGSIIISFAEPWYSPHGAHMDGFTRIPWTNLLFSERTVLAVRSRYRQDGAKRYEEVEGGLNRMSVAKFERIISESGLKVEDLRLWPVKGLRMVTRVPILRELLTSAVSCVLRMPCPRDSAEAACSR